MNKKTLQKYFRESAATVDKSLKAFKKKRDMEALHKLRVEVKKMKAVLLLQSGSFDDGKLPVEFGEIKKVFKAAGKIREAGINIELLETHRVADKKIKKELKEIVKKKGADFRENVSAYLRKLHKTVPMFLRKFSNLPEGKIIRLFSNALRSLAASSQVRMGSVQLHDCRKQLKNLLYIHSSLSPAMIKKMKVNIFYLKKLEEMIGEWHDVIIVIDLLKEQGYSEKEMPGKLLAEKVRSRKKVNELLIDFHRNAHLS
jgi:CHAD domain-containing protein